MGIGQSQPRDRKQDTHTHACTVYGRCVGMLRLLGKTLCRFMVSTGKPKAPPSLSSFFFFSRVSKFLVGIVE